MIQLDNILQQADGTEYQINGSTLVVSQLDEQITINVNNRLVSETQAKFLLSLDQNAIMQDCLYDSDATGFERLQEFIDFCIVDEDGLSFDNSEYQTKVNNQKVYRKQYFRENGSYWIYKLDGKPTNVEHLNEHFNALTQDSESLLVSNESSRLEALQERYLRLAVMFSGLVLLAGLVWYLL